MYSTFIRAGIWPQIFGAERLGDAAAGFVVGMVSGCSARRRRRRDFSETVPMRQRRGG
jgi:hypothetical protein